MENLCDSAVQYFTFGAFLVVILPTQEAPSIICLARNSSGLLLNLKEAKRSKIQGGIACADGVAGIALYSTKTHNNKKHVLKKKKTNLRAVLAPMATFLQV